MFTMLFETFNDNYRFCFVELLPPQLKDPGWWLSETKAQYQQHQHMQSISALSLLRSVINNSSEHNINLCTDQILPLTSPWHVCWRNFLQMQWFNGRQQQSTDPLSTHPLDSFQCIKSWWPWTWCQQYEFYLELWCWL